MLQWKMDNIFSFAILDVPPGPGSFHHKGSLLVPQVSRNVDVHPEDSVMDIHREYAYIIIMGNDIEWESHIIMDSCKEGR
jgi:hypothetical protein